MCSYTFEDRNRAKSCYHLHLPWAPREDSAVKHWDPPQPAAFHQGTVTIKPSVMCQSPTA